MIPLTIFDNPVPRSSRRERLRAVPKHRKHAGSAPLLADCASLQTIEVAWMAGCVSARCTAERPRPCADRPLLALNQLDFRFFISRDGEFVHLELTGDGVAIDLGGRAHHHALAALAQRRLADRTQGLPETSCGWVYADDLHREAGIDAVLVNLHVFRARQLLATKGISDAATIIERRASTREIRIGTDRISIQTL
jgi:hypothetical protein